MVTVAQKEIFNHYDISVLGNLDSVKFINTQAMRVEPPFEFRACTIDAEFLGAFSYLGGGVSIVRNVKSIGRFCSISSNLHFGPVEHPADTFSAHPMFQRDWRTWNSLDSFYAENQSNLIDSKKDWQQYQANRFQKITIGNNVWIGEGVFIRQGVQIGDCSIIASRSVVTKDVPAYSIVGGNPAKVIRMRYEDNVIEKLESLKWWNYGLNALNNVEFQTLDKSLEQIEENISAGAILYNPVCVQIDKSGDVQKMTQT